MSASQEPTDLVTIPLEALPERRFIRPGLCHRHIAYVLRVARQSPPTRPERRPLALALVLDRSGSMSGEKIETAKRAATTALDLLDERDQVTLVIFDSEIEVLQPVARVTPTLKARLAAALKAVQARSSTALHEGWLRGCQELAPAVDHDPEALGRCFLLTDGLANIGETDPEMIAADVQRVRTAARIGTSTFGIGADYHEGLLGPMATAGGGQFHHLRTTQEIIRTFTGEILDLGAVAAPRARLEIMLPEGVSAEVISAYRLNAEEPRHVWVDIGDLLEGEERQVVIRFAFDPAQRSFRPLIRARMVWGAANDQQAGPWQETAFQVAADEECSREAYDPRAVHWMGLEHAGRARRAAILLSKEGNIEAANDLLKKVAQRIARYAGDDAELRAEIAALEVEQHQQAAYAAMPLMAKDAYYQSQRSSRKQKDLRNQ